MPTLPSDLRNQLERVVVPARDAAEAGARAALEALAVHHREPYPHLDPAQRKLRVKLRARARQLGDRKLPRPDSGGNDQEIAHLAVECAYEHWHRMLFARFLAENSLLIEPREKMAISLAEAEELARDEDTDVWTFASRCAQDMLPQIFRPDDPLLQFSFPTEHRIKLERLLDSLPLPVFTASDALGWVYQFWQTKKKKEVNASEVKIGADELPAVTQLFTEPYMVEFLLHNTLGAWWAGKVLPTMPAEALDRADEDSLRKACALPGVDWEYLRFVRGADGKGGPWRPAAGIFEGWPKNAAEIKVLDPCCGSGHFLVAALRHLVPIRMAEEGLTTSQAIDVVLRDNLHGLEIDERCCQIAAFALAFAAWTYTDFTSRSGSGSGGEAIQPLGFRELPELHIACSGIGPQCTKEQWLRLAEDAAARGDLPADRKLLGADDSLLSAPVKRTLEAMYELFAQAPILGSLINPRDLPSDLLHADYSSVAPLLAEVLKSENATDDTRERAIAAAGMVTASDLLAGEYTLVITNVPYLKSGSQCYMLKLYIQEHHKEAKADLATAFIDRSRNWMVSGGAIAFVSQQSWLVQKYYEPIRRVVLSRDSLNLVAALGPRAFATISGAHVNVALHVISASAPHQNLRFAAMTVEYATSPEEKAGSLRFGNLAAVDQQQQKRHTEARIILDPSFSEKMTIGHCADFGKGSVSGDGFHFLRCLWEVRWPADGYRLWLKDADAAYPYSGRSHICLWDVPGHDISEQIGLSVRGQRVWGKRGVAIGKAGSIRPIIYTGELFDDNIAVLVPFTPENLGAIWEYSRSDEFVHALRRMAPGVTVTAGVFPQAPLDLDYWQDVAAEKYPGGLPEPESDDPTQWLFHGRPKESTFPLQTAAARLLGYRWPAELDKEMQLSERALALVKRCDELLKFADNDGIVCIPSIRGEEPAAGRIETLLSSVGIPPEKIRELTGGTTLEDWLRNSFFEEHCKVFHNRPFIWHIWDGRTRDGFHALVNYHKLAEGDGKGKKLLESLTYSYLGDWIARQKDGVKREEGGAEDRLVAALELQKRLEAILEGEPPFDIFVRWKPLSRQPIGWEPDINDGVRLNIRPFFASDLPNGRKGAGILRYKPNIKWGKDRGKEPKRPKSEYPWFWGWDEHSQDFMGGDNFDGNRWNDCHYTNKVEQAARKAERKVGEK